MVIALLVMLGLALGSFVNALVWRIYQQHKARSKKARQALSILHGRSMCTDCRHQLGPLDLLPVFSWLMLRGRCRYCRKPISWQYPAVELLTAALFVFSYVFWPLGWAGAGIAQFVVWLIMLTGFMALAVYDLRWQLLPSRVIFPLGWLALVLVIVLAIWQKDGLVALGAALGVLCLAGLFFALYQLSEGTWIGGGDVRLAVVIGLLVGGPLRVILVLFFASLLGIVASMPMLIQKNGNLRLKIAFGPFLIIATIIVYLFGASLITWYKTQFLLL